MVSDWFRYAEANFDSLICFFRPALSLFQFYERIERLTKTLLSNRLLPFVVLVNGRRYTSQLTTSILSTSISLPVVWNIILCRVIGEVNHAYPESRPPGRAPG